MISEILTAIKAFIEFIASLKENIIKAIACALILTIFAFSIGFSIGKTFTKSCYEESWNSAMKKYHVPRASHDLEVQEFKLKIGKKDRRIEYCEQEIIPRLLNQRKFIVDDCDKFKRKSESSKARIVLWENKDFTGIPFYIEEDYLNLHSYGFGDIFSSLELQGGIRAEVFKDINLEGKSMLLEKDILILDKDWNDKISSIKIKE